MSEDVQYFALQPADLLRSLEGKADGLSEEEARERLERFGANELTAKKRLSALSLYLAQFKNSLILILLFAALLIFFIWFFGGKEQSDIVEGILILAIVFLITILGFVQEWKAEKAIDALKKLLAFQAKVLRDGATKNVDVKDLVPGDVVILEEGEKVPADIRLIEVAELSVNEASLTGESAPVAKTEKALPAKPLQIADQKNMIFSGTVVTQGRGKGIVVATGDQTELGKIATSVSEVKDEPTPIEKRLGEISNTLALIVLAVSGIVFLFIVFFAAEFRELPAFGRVIHSFVAAVSLAVAAIPEGLPAVVTIALALGTQRMLKRKALVRKLNSVETLGSTDVICADKTGTLTKGEMTVREMYLSNQTFEVTGRGYEAEGDFLLQGKKIDPKKLSLLLEAGQLANDAQLTKEATILGDPTEGALLVAAAKARLTSIAKRIGEVPFSSERKMMSVLVEKDGEQRVYTKGAPEVILDHCTNMLVGDKELALTRERKKEILEQTENMSRRALRTLGFAYRVVKERRGGLKGLEQDLIFIGLVGMIDPPRVEVAPLIHRCQQSGIRVIMITGDHASTAAAVAAEIGLTGKTLTGQELDAMSENEFSSAVREVSIYARVNPSFKMRIIEALKQDGHIVAMTGDGVNDAPALKKADIGIAMGKTGTDVAKEASDMVLLDDHFASIVWAIEEGRGIFHNVKKFVNYLLSCNIGEVLAVFLGVLILQDILFTASMLLWINVVTDGLPAVALGLDPAEKGILRYKPQKFQGEIIDRTMWVEMIVFGLLMAGAVLGLYVFNLPEGVREARSAAFMGLVIFELVRLFQIRADYRISFFSNPWLLVAIGTSIVLQLLILGVPFLADLFKVQGIDTIDWTLIVVGSIAMWLIFDAVRPLIQKFSLPPGLTRTSVAAN